MVLPELEEDDAPYRHPLSRRIVAAVAIAALVLSAIGVGLAIAQGEWGPPPPSKVQQHDGVPA